MHNSLTPLFVGGTGRSGTTAVFRVLASGKGFVSAAPELRVHIDPKGALNLLDALSDGWSPYEADSAIHEFVSLMRSCRRSNRVLARATGVLARYVPISPWRYPGLALGSHFGYSHYDSRLDELVDELTVGISEGYWAGTRSFSRRPTIYETKPMQRVETARLIGAFFHDLYASIADQNDRYWVESSPYSILHAEKLLELFPRAKFIHVVRFPLDIVASYLRMNWGGNDASLVARRLAGIHERWQIVRGKIPDSSYIEVRLEDIADDPENSWNEIARFLDPETDYDFDNTSIRPGALNRNRWQDELPEPAAGDAYAILQTVIDEYEYR